MKDEKRSLHPSSFILRPSSIRAFAEKYGRDGLDEDLEVFPDALLGDILQI
jgi:hypothetical protein